MKKLLLLVLGVSLPAVGGKIPFDLSVENTTILNPECPVTLTGVYADPPGRTEAKLSVHFVNHTTKRIVAAKFAAIGIDAVKDLHPFPNDYAVPVNLKPEKEAKPSWKFHYDDLQIDIASGIRVALVKLLFTDGSEWKDDGAKSCYLSLFGRPGRRQLPPE